jgi:Pvc16 N-terminal domain
MSSALAVAAVTAALKDLLNNGLLDHDLSAIGSFVVTALPPDRVGTGQNEPNQLNLFLYQVTPNAGWSNVNLPTRGGDGNRLGTAPLALDLHYLLTAYGAKDLNAEVLLGYAMMLLHETPVLTREQLRIVLGGPALVDGTILPSPFGSLSAADLADQVELVKISPVFLSTEDLSKLWTAMQARYRPTVAYTASVVLIEAGGGQAVAAPVLTQGEEDHGPTAVGAALPSLSGARSATSELFPAVRLGEDTVLTGENLAGWAIVNTLWRNAVANVERTVPVVTTTATTLTVHLPSVAEDAAATDAWAPGVYTVSVLVSRPDLPQFPVGAVPVAVAPEITVSSLSGPAGDVHLTVTCTPRLRPAQHGQVRFIFGTRQVVPDTITTPADTSKPTEIEVTVANVKPGEYLLRIRVDGIDSLPVRFTGFPPKLSFDPQQRFTVS